MKKLSMVDKGFLIGESREQPMHVGGLNLYTLPEGADEQSFLEGLAQNMRDAEALLPPFGDRLKTGRLGTLGNIYWEPDPSMDMDYHIRHSALPKPGRYRELFNLVSRLHGTLLERSRPLWEMHLIEGLQNRQFAVYTKTHHAAIDGARSIHVSRNMLSPDPNHMRTDSPLSLASWEAYKANLREGKKQPYSESELRTVNDIIKSSLGSGVNAINALRELGRAWTDSSSELAVPHLHVPRSPINGKIDGARRFVAQSWSFDRIKRVAAAYDGTFNDAVLAMCSGAMRKYMMLHSELPADSLKAMVPVSLRQESDLDAGNAIAAISADLATDIGDPAARIAAIQASVRAGKDYFRGMSNAEIELYSLAMAFPTLVLLPLGLISRLPPYNLAISNVPGIRQPMYWNGARLDGTYPLSIVTDGMALNITLVTYDKNVDFGIIACRRSMPAMQRLIDYMEDSLQELEDAAGFAVKTPKSGAKPKVVKKKATARKPVAKAKPAPKAKLKPKTKANAKTKRKAATGTATKKTAASKAASSKPKTKPKTKRASVKKAARAKVNRAKPKAVKPKNAN